MSVDAFEGIRLARADAIARVVAERIGSGCLMCDLLAGKAGPIHVLERGRFATAALARYALRPAHALVVAHRHVTSISALEGDAWLELAAIARRACQAIDAVFEPARCYVASLGTDEDVPMSSPHVHLHVVPVGRGSKPSEVLTWEHGVFVPTSDELAETSARLVAAWPAAI
jgi:diadenosine tetraphosphate (Ap4A) HIT family hydrolase